MTLLRWTDMGENRGKTSAHPHSLKQQEEVSEHTGESLGTKAISSLGSCALSPFVVRRLFQSKAKKKSIQTLSG